MESKFGSEDDDYLTVDQLHMPADNLHVRMRTELKKKLSTMNGGSATLSRTSDQPCLDKSMSTSITELLMNTGIS